VQLHFGNAAIGWVVTAYVLTFGGFLLFGGRAADLFGRRRMLLAGMVAFTVCSFLVGISPDPALLVVLRGAQGMSAALMSPAARPPNSRNPPNVSTYAVTTQPIAALPKCSCTLMTGSATLMTVTSRMTMNCAIATQANTSHFDR